jgi:aconitate hydratase
MSLHHETRSSLTLSTGKTVHYYSLRALEERGLVSLARLPMSIKILLESLLRMQGHPAYTEAQIAAFCRWSPRAELADEFPFMPTRVLFQDFTGVPCVVDLAAMRAQLARMGHDPALIEPQIPVDLVIDHSVQIDEYRGAGSFDINLNLEFERNHERYVFLRWGQGAFKKLTVLPPGLGICHQVNMEYLASCVGTRPDAEGRLIAFPDSLVGTDSHTTMINAMGVLGWGVGGIEAEAAMLGQPIPLLTPKVVGCRLVGRLPAGCMPTDVALEATRVLRAKGVVEQFVEYFGPGLDHLTVADRAPIANMSPEYGATMGLFPIDRHTLDYLRMTGRPEEQVELVERYCKEQGLWREPGAPDAEYSDVIEIDLSTLRPSVAGPKRPQDQVAVADLHRDFAGGLTQPADAKNAKGFGVKPENLADSARAGGLGELRHGSVVIASITSCTNTSNPTLLLGAGLLARKAVERGLKVPATVKTSLAPGSRVVTQYLKDAGVLRDLEKLGFYVVAYGCTTCIGNSGPMLPEIESAIKEKNLVVASVLSGNRNFEGRVHPLTKANYLASPPLVVAYALKGTVAGDLFEDPLGTGTDGKPVYLREIWPTLEEIQALLATANDPAIYKKLYTDVAESSPAWSKLENRSSPTFAFDSASTYIREPTFFDGFTPEAGQPREITGARALGVFGDFITTDHISPAGNIAVPSPAASYLQEHGVTKKDFNSYGSRRGNHEVMMRGTFANIRIRNKLASKEGPTTRFHPTGEELFIYDAAMRYREAGTPLVVLAGKLYGAGSSRDWAAKGTFLLGVKAVIAESFERIHRSNLVEMGVLPLEFTDGASAESLGLLGDEVFAISGIADQLTPHKRLTVTATAADGHVKTFTVKCRIDSAIEVEYYRHGGIMPYVLRDVIRQQAPA